MKLFTPVVALLANSDVASGSLRATKKTVLVKAPMMRKFHLLIILLDWILLIADAQYFDSNVSINLTATVGIVALPHVAKALAVAHEAKKGNVLAVAHEAKKGKALAVAHEAKKGKALDVAHEAKKGKALAVAHDAKEGHDDYYHYYYSHYETAPNQGYYSHKEDAHNQGYYPCDAEVMDFYTCMGKKFAACLFDIIKDLEDDTTCEDLENSDFCEDVVHGCGASVTNDCSATGEALETCAMQHYPDDVCEGLCEEKNVPAIA